MMERRLLIALVLMLGHLPTDAVPSAHAEENSHTSPTPTATPFRGRFWPGKGPESKELLHPKNDLKLTISQPQEVGSSEAHRHPWIQLAIRNAGKQPWYFSRSAELVGMEISVYGPDGKKLPLNHRGIQKAKSAFTSLPGRTIDLLPGGTETFKIALGDYMNFPLVRKYRVQIRWTVNMHPTATSRGASDMNHDRGLSPTLESNFYEIDFHGQQK